eukprot:gb/GECH01009733.1/.p1 GENE.gb/GECH01009733.1/~~gb/GECH01009733.1/.p1  ORF type:complete len:630 (+),score=141.87 gb/GECH01009733.1/:1-1890(+)
MSETSLLISSPVTPNDAPIQERDKSYHITLSWKDIYFNINKNQVLSNVSAFASPGDVLAVMGPSGAGKTTLLDILALRKTKGKTEGSVKLNGENISHNKVFFNRNVGYVMQEDALFGSLTVRETLMYSALMRLPLSVSYKKKKQLVSALLKELGLWKVRDNLVGDQLTRGISGGEKKRLSIGVELITDPSLLFLDEPTTGLDGQNALSVVKSLHRIANTRQKTIVMTIHQPRANIFSRFTKLLLLSPTGQVAYFGPCSQAMSYFESVGYSPRDQFMNPADFMLDIISGEFNHNEDEDYHYEEDAEQDAARENEKSKMIEYFTLEYNQSAIKKEMMEEVDLVHESKQHSKSDLTPVSWKTRLSSLFHSAYVTPMLWQMLVLIHRGFLASIRNKTVTLIPIGSSLVTALVVGAIYFQLPVTADAIRGRIASLFFVINYASFSSLNALGRLITERVIFNREHASNTYRTSAYWISGILVEFTFVLIKSILWGTALYFMIGYQMQADKFLSYLLIIATVAGISTAICELVSAVFNSFSAGNAVLAVVMALQMLFMGFLVKLDNIPKAFRWLNYISFFKYGFQCLMDWHLNVIPPLPPPPYLVPLTVSLGKPYSRSTMFLMNLSGFLSFGYASC